MPDQPRCPSKITPRRACAAGAAAIIILSITLPLAGCLTPANPYALSPRETEATLAGQELALETLRRTAPPEAGGGGGGGGGGD